MNQKTAFFEERIMGLKTGSILLAFVFLLGPGVPGSVEAATMCKTFTDASTDIKPIGPIAKKRAHASMQIFITSGSGSVGSYTIQESNVYTNAAMTYTASPYGWVDNGTAVTSAGFTKKTDATAQFVRIKINTLPAASTTVRVCLYADGIHE
jgi:hypothetical protein